MRRAPFVVLICAVVPLMAGAALPAQAEVSARCTAAQHSVRELVDTGQQFGLRSTDWTKPKAERDSLAAQDAAYLSLAWPMVAAEPECFSRENVELAAEDGAYLKWRTYPITRATP